MDSHQTLTRLLYIEVMPRSRSGRDLSKSRIFGKKVLFEFASSPTASNRSLISLRDDKGASIARKQIRYVDEGVGKPVTEKPLAKGRGRVVKDPDKRSSTLSVGGVAKYLKIPNSRHR